MGEEGSWDAVIEEWLMDTTATGSAPCCAGGLAQQDDGNFYAAAPTAAEAGWALIFKENYKEKILQEDGETEKEMDIWEGAGLKTLVDTGKKPEWGFWLGGKKYNILQQRQTEVGDNTFQTFLCSRIKGGVIICKTKSQIVAGFYDEEKGQVSASANKATTDFASYLMDIGY
mmetsp:Transcript_72763/g.126300  ORF Transcript_72763/g.126300 Transcript_72763/m.126300 type:complete len:172 (+) Transcript_72763:100-615(+)